jgi:aspartate carbamoyltransferase catalytic subunit
MMRHFLSIDDLSTEQIETILDWAKHIESGWGHCRSMNNKCLSCFFSEPSTRTRFSFERAMHWLGGRVVTAADASASSSLKKGETLKDTFRTLGQYSDAIVMRHSDPEWPEVARKYSRVPVINAGSGSGEHPTQALLDLHTIRQKWGSVDGLNIMICGDLQNGRTVHSLISLLDKYSCKIHYCPARITDGDAKLELGLPDKYLRSHDCTKIDPSDANDALKQMDVLYMTRIQMERLFPSGCLPVGMRMECMKIDSSNISLVKTEAAILHPLPRGIEISPDIDDDPRADYHERQVRNGLYVRTALLDYVLYGNPIIKPF